MKTIAKWPGRSLKPWSGVPLLTLSVAAAVCLASAARAEMPASQAPTVKSSETTGPAQATTVEPTKTIEASGPSSNPVKTEASSTAPTKPTSAGVGKSIPVKAASPQSLDAKKKQEFWKSLLNNRRIAWTAGDLRVPVDTIETTSSVILNMEVPGVDENTLDVTVNKDTVTIKGEKIVDMTMKADDFRRIERTYGSFEKIVQLPASVDSNAASASMKNGILTLVMPKVAEAPSEGKKISVKKMD